MDLLVKLKKILLTRAEISILPYAYQKKASTRNRRLSFGGSFDYYRLTFRRFHLIDSNVGLGNAISILQFHHIQNNNTLEGPFYAR